MGLAQVLAQLQEVELVQVERKQPQLRLPR
jgi:hypothetical protein